MGRDKIISQFQDIFTELKNYGYARKGGAIIITGARGLGKTSLNTVLLDKAEKEYNFITLAVQARKNISLTDVLLPQCKVIGEKFGLKEKLPSHYRVEASLNLGIFSLNVKEEAKNIPPSTINLYGILDSLISLPAALSSPCPIIISIDEIQYVSLADLSELAAFAQKINIEALPVLFIFSGLPQIKNTIRKNASFLERALTFPLPVLSPKESEDFLLETFRRSGEKLEPAIAKTLAAESGGYPYALQVYGDKAWIYHQEANESPEIITQAARLDLETLFEERWTAASPLQRKIIRIIAENPTDSPKVNSGTIAKILEKKPQQVTTLIERLLESGTIIRNPHNKNLELFVPAMSAWIQENAID